MNGYQPLIEYGRDDCFCDYDNKSLSESLEIIKETVLDIHSKELLYNYLLIGSSSNEQQEHIRKIRNEERRHRTYLEDIYLEYTGYKLNIKKTVDFCSPKSYEEGIRQGIFGELEAVRKYRKIKEGLPHRHNRDILFEIITDELIHAGVFNYIYANLKR